MKVLMVLNGAHHPPVVNCRQLRPDTRQDAPRLALYCCDQVMIPGTLNSANAIATAAP